MDYQRKFEINQIWLEAKDKGVKAAAKQWWKNYYLQKIAAGEMDEIIVGLQRLREEFNDKESRKATDWILITINPYLHVKMEELRLVITKILNKKWIKTYTYCYEQRSETSEDYKGFHVHLLLYRKDKKQCELTREIRNTCKNICDISNTHILNFRHLRTDDDVAKAYNYITGEKADENKHIKQMIDKEFRQHYYLKPYYINDPDKKISDIINKNKNGNDQSIQSTQENNQQEENIRENECVQNGYPEEES